MTSPSLSSRIQIGPKMRKKALVTLHQRALGRGGRSIRPQEVYARQARPTPAPPYANAESPVSPSGSLHQKGSPAPTPIRDPK